MCVCVYVAYNDSHDRGPSGTTSDPGVCTAGSQESPALNTGSQRAARLSWPQLGAEAGVRRLLLNIHLRPPLNHLSVVETRHVRLR